MVRIRNFLNIYSSPVKYTFQRKKVRDSKIKSLHVPSFESILEVSETKGSYRVRIVIFLLNCVNIYVFVVRYF